MSSNRLEQALNQGGEGGDKKAEGMSGLTPVQVKTMCEEAKKRFGKLAQYLAPHAVLQLVQEKDPVKAMYAIQMGFITTLFARGEIIFRDRSVETPKPEVKETVLKAETGSPETDSKEPEDNTRGNAAIQETGRFTDEQMAGLTKTIKSVLDNSMAQGWNKMSLVDGVMAVQGYDERQRVFLMMLVCEFFSKMGSL